MGNIIKQVVRFIRDTGYQDLPDNAVLQIKRVILDSIGCSISGQASERGKAVAVLAKSIGGAPEATIFGVNGKVSCMEAAFANGESMNSLDYDALSTAVHDVPVIIPATLAMSEAKGASGKELILATAVAFEISARLKRTGARPSVAKSGEMKWPAVLGYSAATLAASVGASKIADLDDERMVNAIAIAAGIAPPNIFRNFLERSPIQMIKYGAMGWQAKAGITAALLAQNGYTAYADIFEGEYGFYRYTGMGIVPEENLDHIFSDLGKAWTCHQITYKPYPAAGHIIPALGKFIQIIEEHEIRPGDITAIELHLDALSKFPLFKKNNAESADDYSFHVPYLLSCAAHRISPARWHDDETKEDPVIWQFIQRVKFLILSDEREAGIANQDGNIRVSHMSIKLETNGSFYEQELEGIGALTDHELVSKFSDNVTGFLPHDRAEGIAERILGLERSPNISQLLALFH